MVLLDCLAGWLVASWLVVIPLVDFSARCVGWLMGRLVGLLVRLLVLLVG